MTADEVRRHAEWAGPPRIENTSRVHLQLRQVLTSWGLPGDAVDDAVLVAAELLANVVEHARTPFRLVAQVRGPLLHLAVDDGFVGAPPEVTARGVSGLRLVTAVAVRWGWQERTTGKTVWVELMA